MSWLRDFVDVREPAAELAQLLSMRGFEPGAIEGAPPGPLAPEGRHGARPRHDTAASDPSDDGVIDFEITANRPDCMNVLGIAREVSTAYGRPLAHPPAAARQTESSTAAPLAVTIEDPDLCPRYAAAVAEVTVGQSPAWLANRLLAAGVRPINTIVDVTNYVMIELGQPMHAFDLDKLEGRELRIRRARGGERLRTLDGEDRALTADMLVIADATRPQAIGGVMGGRESEVGHATRRIAFESAYFTPSSVRRTSKRLGLKTEASARFERGADIGAPVWALERACALMEAIGAGRVVGEVIDRYPAPRPPTRVRFRERVIERHLGQRVDRTEAARILRQLGFTLEDAADGWEVVVPSFRVDVTREIDLVEEVARHAGYDRLPATFPVLRAVPRPSDPRIDADRLVRRILTGAGFAEAVTFAFIESQAASAFAPAGEIVAIAHPLSEKFAVLRPSLLPGLIESVGYNRRREQRTVRLFEIGRRFRASAGETRTVGLAWSGAGSAEHWSAKPRDVDFFDLKGVVDRLCGSFRLKPSFVRFPQDAEGARYLVAGRSARIEAPDGVVLGVVGQLAPPVAETRDLPRGDDVFVAELDLDALAAATPRADVRVEPLPRFPSIARDISVLVDERLPAGRVRATILAVAPATLERVQEFDRYRGRGIPDDKTSLSLRLTFRATDRTLTDAEIEQAMAVIVFALEREHRAVRR
ncbi:MAG: phenylalanine--tRNA ligase subunit beta [Acidobacteria bacterium]|nr:phenylalanine--tRNA ligase subunit beta [Acidobacteriota bacterium]